MVWQGNKAFTLIELLIALALVGILAAIAVFQMASYRLRSNNSSALSDLASLKTHLEAYFAEHQKYP
jgi:prepilin-type N-terminal cleavage/methylation domain-containing protein